MVEEKNVAYPSGTSGVHLPVRAPAFEEELSGDKSGPKELAGSA